MTSTSFSVQTSSGTHTASYPLGTVVPYPERVTDSSHPSSAEVMNEWSYTSTPQFVFMAWYLVKHKFTLTSRSLVLPFMVFIRIQ